MSRRGPSTMSIGAAVKSGLGLPIPNGAIAVRCSTTAGVIASKPSGPSRWSCGRRSSGPSRSSAWALTARRKAATSAAASCRPGRLLVAAEAVQHRRARLERRQDVEARDAAARAVGLAVLDRQHDRRPVVGVDQLRGDDADDAAVPALAGDDQHRLRADVGIGVDDLAGRGDDVLLLLAAAGVLGVELLGQRLRLGRQRLVVGQQQARRQIGGGHAAGGVDPRRDHERDVIGVDGLAGRARRRRAARAVRRLCGPRVSSSSPSLAMTRFSPTSGTTSASVPMAAILTNAGSQASRPAFWQSACTSFERDADAGQVLVGIPAVGALGVDHRQRRRQLGRRARGGR